MKTPTRSRREQIRAMLADLKLPGSLEAIDNVLSEADGGKLSAAEAIEKLLGAQKPRAGLAREGELKAITLGREWLEASAVLMIEA